MRTERIFNHVKVLNPSFEEWQQPVISGIAVPTGWTICGIHGAYYTDAETFTVKSPTSLKMTMGKFSGQQTWIGQKVSGLKPLAAGEKYGLAGWVQADEFPNIVQRGAPLTKMRLEIAVATDGREVKNTDGLEWQMINPTQDQWFQFGWSFELPAGKDSATFFIRINDNWPGVNICYFDSFDDPQWVIE